MNLPLRSFLLPCLSLGPILYAQSSDATGEEVVELSPFEVTATQEQGYFASDTNSATRFSIDRRDAPFSISSLTADLLDDAGVVDAIETLDLDSSATPVENVFSGGNNRPSIRGTSSPRFFVEGSFFNSTVAPGGVAVDRVEILKGTSAMLYGQGEPGGTVNYVLKKPLKQTKGRLQTMVGSFQESLVEIDYTAPLLEDGSLSFLVGYSRFYGESVHDRYSNEKNDGFARMRWEYDGFDRYVDIYHVYARDETEGIVQHILDGFHGITNLQMKGDLFQRYESNDLPTPFDVGLIDPDSHNDAADGSFAEVETNSTTVTWNHRYSDIFTLRVNYNQTRMPRYLWRNLADPTQYVELLPTRNYLLTDPETGAPTLITVERGDIIKNSGGQVRDDALESDSIVVNLLAEFRGEWGSYKTVLGFDHIGESFSSRSFYSDFHNRQNANGTRSLSPFGDRIPIVLGNVLRPEEGLTSASEPFSSYTIDGGQSTNENRGAGFYWTSFLELFNRKLTAVSSLRYDTGSITIDSFRPSRTDGLDPFTAGEPQDYENGSYSIGANFLIGRSFGVFANYATSFRPETSIRTGRDEQPITDARDPFEGQGWDAGFKFSSQDEKIFAMLTFFEARKENLWVRQQGQAIDSMGNLLWEDDAQTIPRLISFEAQTGEQLASGVEFEFNAQISDDLDVRLGWTYLAKAEISEDEEAFLVGQELDNSPEHKIVAGMKYHIRKGFLSYAQIGFNVTALIDDRIYWVGPTNRRLNAGSLGDESEFIGEADRFWGEGYTKVDLFFSKRFRPTDELDVWLRLNVYNLLDEDYQRYRQRGDPLSYRASLDLRW